MGPQGVHRGSGGLRKSKMNEEMSNMTNNNKLASLKATPMTTMYKSGEMSHKGQSVKLSNPLISLR